MAAGIVRYVILPSSPFFVSKPIILPSGLVPILHPNRPDIITRVGPDAVGPLPLANIE